MATKRIQLLHDTKTVVDTFTGLDNELTVVSDNKNIRLHDGTTVGGAANFMPTLTFDSYEAYRAAILGNTIPNGDFLIQIDEGYIGVDGGAFTVGDIVMSTNSADRPGWLKLQTTTQQISKTLYPDLYTACGTRYGTETTELFTIPSTVQVGDYVIDYASNLSGTGYTNGWYRKYASGWVEQSGLTIISGTTGNPATITLPITMNDNVYSVVGINAGPTDINTSYSATAYPLTASTILVASWFTSTATNYRNIRWEVKGYAATSTTDNLYYFIKTYEKILDPTLLEASAVVTAVEANTSKLSNSFGSTQAPDIVIYSYNNLSGTNFTNCNIRVYKSGWVQLSWLTLTTGTSNNAVPITLPISMLDTTYSKYKTFKSGAVLGTGFDWSYISDKVSSATDTTTTAYFSIPSNAYALGAFCKIEGFADTASIASFIAAH